MIDQQVYLGLKGIRKAKSPADFTIQPSLKELLARSWGTVTPEQAINAFTSDLKGILEEDQITEMVKRIFALQNATSQLQQVNVDIPELWPNLDQFFRNLSPVLLQALYHNLLANDQDEGQTNTIIHQWVSAIRVAVEEEYYFWQEKMLDNRAN